MKLSEFDYLLPEDRIAQRPAPIRDASRMLVVNRESTSWEDRWFRELPAILQGNELLVVNNTRVIPARLFGKRSGVGAEPVGRQSNKKAEYLSATIEVLLLRETGDRTWSALVRPGRKVRVGERIVFGDGELEAEVVGRGKLGERLLRFLGEGRPEAQIERLGHTPLPPYIARADEPADRERYQTVFARKAGAVAAPTAGLHFTAEALRSLQVKGVEICELTLHVGLGTFQPIHGEEIEQHRMHSEAYEIPEATSEAIRHARRSGRPVVAVGTTVVRALEDAAQKVAAGKCDEVVRAGAGEANLFIQPGHPFRVVDQMITNFHLPRSTLLVLVSAFAGRELILRAYQHAVDSGYRFYSYGDCMLIR
jgi:S-adenosylmethionine:tRNA ribosyltransferase-isomerase